ncbi:general negative regulator of transcription subunit 3 [Echria macrotheca]|uniref:General negative regulator of transcription subunit n=1 Tax=Echria macrotheca TaxID=438768 RepID=A0AAJ0B339_9PEZI|nr:general negative regulator of transcription subunit 3 [Echria macrotheca]
MAARKLQQEVDKCFKKVHEGVAEFDAIYEKIEQSNNPAQKDKLEDQLKREIKKLQRMRDQIKTWAASNDIKDKGPLQEHRRLIETQMERFKAVEKAMKTKAYSKEGLSAAAKLDPKEQAKMEASEFLSSMVDELEQQIETLEAEGEAIQATMKKGKGQSHKAERMAQIEQIIERHKWHQGKLELIRRSLENGGVEAEQVTELEESIRYYVSDGMNDDFIEDDGLYDDLDLQEEGDVYGMNLDNDKGSSQDNQSIQDDAVEADPKPTAVAAGKQRATTDAAAGSAGRRPSTQLKSPLPTLATVHTTPLPTISNGPGGNAGMKPASVPTRPAGEGLKYASAAAAAAASDKNNVGIAPLPPPPSATPNTGISPLPATLTQQKASTTSSPSSTSIQPVIQERPANNIPPPSAISSTSTLSAGLSAKSDTKTVLRGKAPAPSAAPEHQETTKGQTNGAANARRLIEEEEAEEESIYHLPSSLHDLMESFEVTKNRPATLSSAQTRRMQTLSEAEKPDLLDSEPPRRYQPENVYISHNQFPQEPLTILDDPRLYQRIDPDTLFYVFYYKQGTYQQYLAAKALKDQSWRFHKQYQTWFQRHEEPKAITEEYEQGTYRFFDYESTWMNRRKADFKFAYRFLEDDVC